MKIFRVMSVALLALTSCGQPNQSQLAETPDDASYSRVGHAIPEGESQYQFVSLIALIQAPEKFQGKRVAVIGYAGVEFEGNALYVSKEDYRNSITKNALCLDIEADRSNKKMDQKYVLVTGVFDGHRLGHLRMNSGCLTEIAEMRKWNSSSRPEPGANVLPSQDDEEEPEERGNPFLDIDY